jgi:hypothetical protein
MSANKVFALIVLILLAMTGVSIWTAVDMEKRGKFTENMAAANAEVAQAQAQAIEAQARAIEIQAEANRALEAHQAAQARADQIRADVLTVILLCTIPVLIILVFATIYTLTRRTGAVEQ